jgi:hypothetical protein
VDNARLEPNFSTSETDRPYFPGEFMRTLRFMLYVYIITAWLVASVPVSILTGKFLAYRSHDWEPLQSQPSVPPPDRGTVERKVA